MSGFNPNNMQEQRLECVLTLGNLNEANFEIMEQNQYQQFRRIGLKLKQGNDQKIKQYLSEKLKEAKESIASQNHSNSTLTEELDLMRHTNEQLSGQLQNSREENRKIADIMEIEEKRKLNDQKEKMLLEMSETIAKCEKERKDLQQKLENGLKMQTDIYNNQTAKLELAK